MPAREVDLGPVGGVNQPPKGFAAPNADPALDEQTRPSVMNARGYGRGHKPSVGEEKIRDLIKKVVDDERAATAAEANTFATFVSLRGSSHQIILNPMEMETVTHANVRGMAPMMRFVPNSGKRVQFVDGLYVTDNMDEIEALLDTKFGFRSDYDIDENDPTGFWERIGVVTAEVVPTRVITGRTAIDAVRVIKGSITTANAGDVPHAR